MSTPTDFSSPDAASAIVLTHPAFDRPPVHNERRPGPKKGTHSLAMVRRQRAQPSEPRLSERQKGFIEGYRGVHVGPAQPAPELPGVEREPWNIRAKGDAASAQTATTRSGHEQAVIDAALAIIEERLRAPAAVLDQPQAVKAYLRMHLAGLDREAFGVMFFDVGQRLIAFEVLFEGTLTHTAVHPREVARRALQLNAASVVLAHNHPSGVAEASRSDELLTCLLQKALGLFDVRVLDHVIVVGNGAMSFAERGLL